MIPHRISDRSITVVLDNKVHTIDRTSMNAPPLLVELEKAEPDAAIVRELVTVKGALKAITSGLVSFDGADQLMIAGEMITGYIAERIARHHREGVDVRPMLTFLDLVWSHPVPGLKNDLFRWVENGDMPMTAEGHVIAYKKVNEEYRSYHASPDGTHLLHEIGGFVQMPREQVNTNRHQTCSTGLHFCSYNYLREYHGTSGRILILSIHPHDIMAIPTDYNHTKGRASGYKIIGELPLEEAGKFFSKRLVVNEFQKYKTGNAEATMTVAEVAETRSAKAQQIQDLYSKVANDRDATAAAELQGMKKASKKSYEKLGLPAEAGDLIAELLGAPVAVEKKAADQKVKTAIPVKKAEPKKAAKAPAKPTAVAGAAFSADNIPATLLDEVKANGQTATAKKYGVARSTLQGWIKKLNG